MGSRAISRCVRDTLHCFQPEFQEPLTVVIDVTNIERAEAFQGAQLRA